MADRARAAASTAARVAPQQLRAAGACPDHAFQRLGAQLVAASQVIHAVRPLQHLLLSLLLCLLCLLVFFPLERRQAVDLVIGLLSCRRCACAQGAIRIRSSAQQEKHSGRSRQHRRSGGDYCLCLHTAILHSHPFLGHTCFEPHIAYVQPTRPELKTS